MATLGSIFIAAALLGLYFRVFYWIGMASNVVLPRGIWANLTVRERLFILKRKWQTSKVK